MSHLKQQISALIDGELTGAELDRANAHLAACARCRADAAALRQLKRELRALGASPFDGSTGPGDVGEELTRRLLGMAGPGGPVPSSKFRREQFRRARSGTRPASWRGGAGRGPSGPGDRGVRAGALPRHQRENAQPYSWVRATQPRRRRGRYMLWSAVSLVVVGIGTAAFSMGGATAEPGPRITPQLQMFSVEHAINSGDVPFPEPTQATTARP